MSMEVKRHVSRWHRCADNVSSKENQTIKNVCNESQNSNSENMPLSMRYMNEFVGKLQCSSMLLQHQLYPDAKEITESMGLFNAARRYLLHDDRNGNQEDKPDGIIVVGDGNTPRTAAMFAYRLKGWKCYSIDPAMENNSTERSKGWEDIEGLVIIQNKIENIQITCRRAILVLVHAHVTLEQARCAIDADKIVGLVTLPCCNWYGKQEMLFGRHPDLVYDDFSILSDHREIRVWVGENGPITPLKIDTSCIKKEFRQQIDDMTTAKQSKDRRKSPVYVLSDTFQNQRNSKHLAVPSLDPILTILRQRASVIETNFTHRILLLDLDPSLQAIKELLQKGFDDVSTIQIHEINSCVSLQVLKASLVDSQIQLESVKSVEINDVWADPAIDLDLNIPLFTCVLDLGFVYCGVRGDIKHSMLFRGIYHLLRRFLTSLNESSPLFLTISPRKNLLKSEFLAHSSFDWQVEALKLRFDETQPEKPLLLYCCTPSVQQNRESATDPLEDTKVRMNGIFKLHARMRADYNKILGTPGGDIVKATIETFLPTTDQICERQLIQLSGVILRIRRFSHGMAFLTLSESSTSNISIQIFLRICSLNYDEDIFTRIISLFRKGDRLQVIGNKGKNDRGAAILVATGMIFLQSGFELF